MSNLNYILGDCYPELERCPRPSPSLAEGIDVCPGDRGFSTALSCSNQSLVTVNLYRAGQSPEPPEDDPETDEVDESSLYRLTFSPLDVRGGMYYFVYPVEFFEFPVGYYNADIMHGGQYIKTIRLNLYPAPQASRTKSIAGKCDYMAEPNLDLVEDCTEECTLSEPCEPVTTIIGACCD